MIAILEPGKDLTLVLHYQHPFCLASRLLQTAEMCYLSQMLYKHVSPVFKRTLGIE